MRRFLLTRLPPGDPGPETVIRQVYWRLGEGWTLRLRREGPPGEPSRDWLSVRRPGAGWDFALPAEPAAGLFRAGSAHRVLTIRRAYGAWTVDEYHWENAGLLVGGTAAPGPAPAWCGREITDDPAYEDESLAFRPVSTWSA